MTDKLSFNTNGQVSAPAATDVVTLRQFTAAPISHEDADYNYINIVDRINSIRDEVVALDARVPDFSYDASTKTLTITE